MDPFTLFQDFGIQHGTRLTCDDFHQNYNLIITIVAMSETEANSRDKAAESFEILGDRSQLGPKEDNPQPSSSTNGATENNTGKQYLAR